MFSSFGQIWSTSDSKPNTQVKMLDAGAIRWRPSRPTFLFVSNCFVCPALGWLGHRKKVINYSRVRIILLINGGSHCEMRTKGIPAKDFPSFVRVFCYDFFCMCECPAICYQHRPLMEALLCRQLFPTPRTDICANVLPDISWDGDGIAHTKTPWGLSRVSVYWVGSNQFRNLLGSGFVLCIPFRT